MTDIRNIGHIKYVCFDEVIVFWTRHRIGSQVFVNGKKSYLEICKSLLIVVAFSWNALIRSLRTNLMAKRLKLGKLR